ncbi:MAG: NAD(P)H-dependent oxidoreductase, partial [Clostridia bacterium]|nr:NAD(P)H-dependent oxidoreductase [Clostridia bacterium]
ADLDWRDKTSRSSVEMTNKAHRPALAKEDAKIGEYDVIFLGFPIWWYVAPTIVNSFLEGYDFSGKTLVLFATSGGSGFGNTEKELRLSLAEDTRVITWKVLSPKVTEAELAAELSKLAL